MGFWAKIIFSVRFTVLLFIVETALHCLISSAIYGIEEGETYYIESNKKRWGSLGRGSRPGIAIPSLGAMESLKTKALLCHYLLDSM